MKKTLLLFAVLFCVASSSFASSRDLFSINEEMIYTELADLVALESYVTENDATLSGLVATNSALVANVVTSNGITGMATMGEPPLGIPSFVWGFCLGIPGLAIVYFVAEDSDETKKALWGCVAANVVYVAVYVIWWVILVDTVDTVDPYYGY